MKSVKIANCECTRLENYIQHFRKFVSILLHQVNRNISMGQNKRNNSMSQLANLEHSGVGSHNLYIPGLPGSVAANGMAASSLQVADNNPASKIKRNKNHNILGKPK